MMQHFRQALQKFVIWIIVIFISGSFALWGVQNYITSGGGNNTVAKVNGLAINKHELKIAYDRLTQQQQQSLGSQFSNSKEAETKRKKQALHELIDTTLLLSSAQKSGFYISSNETNTFLWSLPFFQENGTFSKEKFLSYLRQASLSVNGFLDNLQDKLLIGQVQNIYASSQFVLPSEINANIRLLNQTRDLVYTTISAKSIKNTISDDQIKTYYEQHQNEFKTPEQVSINYILLSAPELMKSIKPSEKELTDFYNSNINLFKQPAEWNVSHILIKVAKTASPSEVEQAQKKINSIAAQLKQGKNFADVATASSQDIITAKNKGELGWVSAQTFGPEYEKAIAQLKTKGAVSTPFRSQYGFTIIKLNDIKPAQIPTFKQVKAIVAKNVIEQKAQQQLSEKTDQLSDLTYSHPDSLTAAASALHLPILQSSLFSVMGGNDTLTQNKKVIAAAFSPEVLQQHFNSAVIQLSDDSFIVLRINKYQAKTQKPLNQVSASIRSRLDTEETAAKTKTLGQKIIAALKSGVSRDNVAKQNNLQWTSMPKLSVYGLENNPTKQMFYNYAFELPRPQTGKNTSTNGFSKPNGDYVVLVVTAANDGKVAPINTEKRKAYQQDIESNLGLLDYEFYLLSIKQKAKIVIEDEILDLNS